MDYEKKMDDARKASYALLLAWGVVYAINKSLYHYSDNLLDYTFGKFIFYSGWVIIPIVVLINVACMTIDIKKMFFSSKNS